MMLPPCCKASEPLCYKLSHSQAKMSGLLEILCCGSSWWPGTGVLLQQITENEYECGIGKGADLANPDWFTGVAGRLHIRLSTKIAKCTLI